MHKNPTPIEKFNTTFDLWVKELDKFTLDQLLKKPDLKSWSLGQLYEHLLEETNWYNHQIDLARADTKNSGIETSRQARLLFEAGSFADERIQGDPLISENVKQPETIESIKIALSQLKKEVNAQWEKLNHSNAHGKSEHPGIGFLNGFEWLQYAEMHLRHHLKQKERIVRYLHDL